MKKKPKRFFCANKIFAGNFVLKMKLTLILSLVAVIQVTASTYAQNTKLSLNLKNATIEQVLFAIEEQSEYDFFYNNSQINLDQQVSVKFRKTAIFEILDKVLKPNSLDYTIIEKDIVITPSPEPEAKSMVNSDLLLQEFAVKGKVIDRDGIGIPGVNISLSGTPIGTITDSEGNYTLMATDNEGTIVFSFIGYKTQEVTINSRAIIDITLEEEAFGLNEVVVTALGIKRETKKIGYAMTEVKGEELASVNTVSAIEALKGKAAGLSIGQSDGGLFGHQKIQLRGISVMNSDNNNPIFVIDGVILENSFSNVHADWEGSTNDFGGLLKNLNPDDFESVSVLKGAAATALYGSRGINGAIVVKTKDGSGKKGIGVKVSQSFGIDHVFKQPDIQYEYGPGILAGYTNYGDTDGSGAYYRFSTNQFYTDGDGVPTKQGHPRGGFGYGPKYDGRDIIDFDGEMTTYSPAKNNMLDAYRMGINSNTSIALSGGNEKGSFYLSDSYNKRTGIYPTNEFTRNALLFSSSYKLADWLKADVSMSFTTSDPKNPQNDFAGRYAQGGWANWYDTKKWQKEEVFQASHGGTPQSAYGDKYARVPGNSTWFSYYKNEITQKEQVTRPIVRLTADVTNWMSVTVEGNMNHYSSNYESKKLGYGYAMEGGSYELRHNLDVSRTGKLIVNLNKQFTEDISSSLLIGGEIWDQKKSYSRVWTDGGLIFPGQFYVENSKKQKKSEAKINGTKQINSLYFMANLGWKDQVFLDITGRNDWSSALVYTDGTGNNSYFYPSVSAAWLATETFDLPSWVSFGKLRFSWAQVGNDTEPYAINKGYKIDTHEGSGGTLIPTNAMSDTKVDADILPERKNSIEAGFDVRFFNNRLGIDFAWYDETIKNQIGNVPLPKESGVLNLFTNVGTLTNSGIELSLRVVPVKMNNFEWISTFNYWHNKTVVTDLHESYGDYRVLNGYINYGNYRIGSVAYDGGEYGILMSDAGIKKWQSVDINGDPIDNPLNGQKVLRWSQYSRGSYYARSGEAEKIGKLQPDFEGSWSNNFRYKNLSLSILIDARFGGHIASYNNRYGTAYGWMETSLKNRDAEHGGITWDSNYTDTQGQTFTDGIIPEGVFGEGQSVTTPAGATVDVGGMSYQEAYDAGYVEPTHASYYTYFNNSWSSGVVNDDWFSEVKYIALRNISIGYTLPKKIADAIKAQGVSMAFNARNLGYLYNSLPNNLNPESFRGTASSAGYLERSFTPYTATYTFTLVVDF